MSPIDTFSSLINIENMWINSSDFAPEVRLPHPAEGGAGVPGSAGVRGSQESVPQILFSHIVICNVCKEEDLVG